VSSYPTDSDVEKIMREASDSNSISVWNTTDALDYQVKYLYYDEGLYYSAAGKEFTMYQELKFFEKVLDRKLNCTDCHFSRANIEEKIFDEKMCFCSSEDFLQLCPRFKMSDKTKVEIKLKDRVIEKNKIDLHPRHKIGQILFPYDWFKLELIL